MASNNRCIVNKGDVFGRWTVLGEAENRGVGQRARRYVLCRCACGNVKEVRFGHLRDGLSQSCGCLSKRGFVHGATKGGKRTNTYTTWHSMKARCLNPNNASYINYGGRGITISYRWRKFENFLADMGERPAGKSLERIDNNKGYSPENCRWATSEEQNRNTRQNRILTFKGESCCLKEWSEKIGIKYTTLRTRLDALNWSVEKALTTSVT